MSDTAAKTCGVEGCDRVQFRIGLCNSHRRRLQRHGDVQADVPLAPRVKRPEGYRRTKTDAPRRRQVHRDARNGVLVCPGCNEERPLDDFPFRKDHPNTRKTVCGQCRRERAAQWRADNPEKSREYSRIDAVRNRAKKAERSQKRRDALAGSPRDSGISKDALRRLDGDECCYCGVGLSFEPHSGPRRPGNMATMEHVVAVSRGGGHVWSNCALACWHCNAKKGARTTWRVREGHRLSE